MNKLPVNRLCTCERSSFNDLLGLFNGFGGIKRDPCTIIIHRYGASKVSALTAVSSLVWLT